MGGVQSAGGGQGPKNESLGDSGSSTPRKLILTRKPLTPLGAWRRASARWGCRASQGACWASDSQMLSLPSRGELSHGQRRQDVQVGDHESRLVERTEQVFSGGDVHARLAPDG